MANDMNRPVFCDNEHLEYLDNLRESGVTNMYGASPYLQEDFPELTKEKARDVLLYWLSSFSERHPEYKEKR